MKSARSTPEGVTGYFRPISAWNRGKAEEARDRVMFKVPGKDK